MYRFTVQFRAMEIQFRLDRVSSFFFIPIRKFYNERISTIPALPRKFHGSLAISLGSLDDRAKW